MVIAALVVLALWPRPSSETVSVFAAASLKEPFKQIAAQFERSNSQMSIELNFGGSQTLAAQIKNGAPADVFASAAWANLNQVPRVRGTSHVFARNRLELAIRKGLTGVGSVEDLSTLEQIVVADVSVPAGAYTESFLKKSGKRFGSDWLRKVREKVVSRELDVKAVLAKVRLGEADAGIVYTSDVKASRGEVRGIPIPEPLNVVAEYPVGIPSSAENMGGARKFIQFLLSKPAQEILHRSGFLSIPVSGERK